jgi:hypothetical protein
MIQTPSNQIEECNHAHPRVEKLDHLIKADASLFSPIANFQTALTRDGPIIKFAID